MKFPIISFILLSALLGTSACRREGGQILLSVSSDIPLTRLKKISLRIERAHADLYQREFNIASTSALPETTTLPFTLTLWSTSTSADATLIVVQGIGTDGKPFIERKSWIDQFPRKGIVLLRMNLLESCADISDCPEKKTCGETGCIDEAIDVTKLPQLTPDEVANELVKNVLDASVSLDTLDGGVEETSGDATPSDATSNETGPGPEVQLSLVPPDGNCGSFLVTGSDEKLPRAAIKITPENQPFSVEKIRYRLLHKQIDEDNDQDIDLDCDATMFHQVLLYRGTGNIPPLSPPEKTLDIDNDLKSITVSRTTIPLTGEFSGDEVHEITVVVPETLGIHFGANKANLYMVFLMAYQPLAGAGDLDDKKAICLMVCPEQSDVNRTRNFYNLSNPIQFISLYDYMGGIEASIQASAFGRAAN